jgi:hypothetical protein
MTPEELVKNTNNPGLFGEEPIYSIEKTPYGDIECQSSLDNRHFFKEQINKYSDDDGIFCEIGVFGGVNLFSLYDFCKIKNMKIIGIDPHDKIEIFNGIHKNKIDQKIVNTRIPLWKIFRENIETIIQKFNLDIKYINDLSWNAYTLISDKSINVLHIDGDHSYDGVTKDLHLFLSKMKNKSVIIIDDIKWKGIRSACDDFCNKNNLKLELNLDNSVGVININI